MYLLSQVDTNIKKVFETFNAVSASVLKKKAPNEEVISLKTNNLEAVLRRSSSESMNGTSVKFSIQNNVEIHIPAEFDVKSFGKDVEDVNVVVNTF